MIAANLKAVARSKAWVVTTIAGTHIATVSTTILDQEGYARLLAASVKMAEALGECITAETFMPEGAKDRLRHINAVAKAALAKAHAR